MRKSDLKLKNVVDKAKSGGVYQISDFMTSDEKKQIRQSNFIGKKSRKMFDEIDAYAAEIIARFGYDAYRAWNAGEIPATRMSRLISAERARERASQLNFEAMMLAAISSCAKRAKKGGPIPKGLKLAQKIFKEETKLAKGDR